MHLFQLLIALVLSSGLLATMNLAALQSFWGSELSYIIAALLAVGLVLEQLRPQKPWKIAAPPTRLSQRQHSWPEALATGLLLSLVLIPRLFFAPVYQPLAAQFPVGQSGEILFGRLREWKLLFFIGLYQLCLANIWRNYGRLRLVFYSGIFLVSGNVLLLLLRLSDFSHWLWQLSSPYAPTAPVELESLPSSIPLLLTPLFSLSNWIISLRFCQLHSSLAVELRRTEQLSRSASSLAESNMRVLDRALLHSSEIRQAERREVAREIHDALGFSLSAGLMGMEVLLEELREEQQLPKELSTRLCSSVEEQQGHVRQAIQQVRLAVSRLRAGNDDDKLRFAKDWELAIAIFGETTQITITHHIPPSLTRLKNPAIGKLIYRIIQEGLTNSLRHGQSSLIDISLLQESGLILLRISDNGRGCDQLEAGNGLSGMMERLDLVGGRLAWQTQPGKGFDLGVEIPCKAGDFFPTA